MFPVIQIGPLALQAPGLLVLVALWIGITLTEKNAKIYKLSADTLSNLILIGLISGVVGGRIAYAARFPDAFSGNLLSLLSLNLGLFDISGGLAATAIGAIIYGQRKNLPLWATLDALVPFFGMLAIGLAVAHLASGDAFGAETDLPWAIDLWGTKRHPSQIYETLAALVTLNLLWPPKPDALSPTGNRFLLLVAFTAGYRLFLEAFRGDSTLIFGELRAAQVGALIVLAAALWLLDKRKCEEEA
ncbi:MAG: prolipoprotein diacylglyceryl transferase [Anaerolineales bacterium]|nr:prolipoprotein diacylglyceryl transferase [Anaerolineales bacterium]